MKPILTLIKRFFRLGRGKIKPSLLILKRHWKRAVLYLIILIVLFIGYRAVTAQPKGMLSTRIERKTLAVTFSSNGQIKAKQEANLKFLVPSKVAWVGVKKGDSVNAWQAVAGLDPRQAKKNLELALRDYSKQRNTFEETWRVTYNGVSDPNTALTDTVKRILEDNQWDLEKAVLSVEQSDLVLENTTLISPISGVVTDTNELKPGQNLSGSDLDSKYIRIVDLSTLYFEARVDEIDFGNVHLGQEVTVTIDAYPNHSCNGTVSYINREGKESTGGVITVPVEITLKDCPLTLATNLNGHADFVTKKVDNALVLPKKYLVTNGSTTSVWVQTGTSLKDRKLVPVTLGATTLTDVQVTKGLDAGETVIFIPG